MKSAFYRCKSRSQFLGQLLDKRLNRHDFGTPVGVRAGKDKRFIEFSMCGIGKGLGNAVRGLASGSQVLRHLYLQAKGTVLPCLICSTKLLFMTLPGNPTGLAMIVMSSAVEFKYACLKLS